MMEYWEFLLQREGDCSWLPLESSAIEILEGQYRLAARSSHPNTNVEVKLLYKGTASIPFEQRIQKRFTKTSAEGLMAVLPFTHFMPGLWELCCSSELLSDLIGESWQHILQLQVLPRDREEIVDWDPDWESSKLTQHQEETDHASMAASTKAELTEPEDSSIVVAPESTHDLESDARPIPALLSQDEGPDQSPKDVPTPQATWVERQPDLHAPMPVSGPEQLILDAPPSLQLFLERDAYRVQCGHSLTIAGRVDWSSEREPSEDDSAYPLTGKLQIRLSTPQNEQVLVRVQQPLPSESPPLAFKCTITIPPDFKVPLILGEVQLQLESSALGEITDAAMTQSFRINVETEQETEESQPQAITEEPQSQPEEHWLTSLLNLSPQLPELRPSLDLCFLDFVNSPKATPVGPLRPIRNQPLPPRIYQSEPSANRSKPPQLPPLPKRSIPLAPGSEDLNALPNLDHTGVGTADTPLDALDFQARFQSRLNALAGDTKLSMDLLQVFGTATSFALGEPEADPWFDSPTDQIDKGTPPKLELPRIKSLGEQEAMRGEKPVKPSEAKKT